MNAGFLTVIKFIVYIIDQCRLKMFRRHLEYLLFSDSLENQAAVL